MEPSKMLKTPHRGIIQTDPITARHDKTWLYIAFGRGVYLYSAGDCIFMDTKILVCSDTCFRKNDKIWEDSTWKTYSLGSTAAQNCAHIHKKEFLFGNREMMSWSIHCASWKWCPQVIGDLWRSPCSLHFFQISLLHSVSNRFSAVVALKTQRANGDEFFFGIFQLLRRTWGLMELAITYII